MSRGGYVTSMVGGVLALVLVPALTVGLMAAARVADAGNFPLPGILFVAFNQGREQTRAILILGGVYAVAVLLVVGLTALIDGGRFAQLYMGGGSMSNELINDPGFITALWVSTLLYLPVSLAFWHAPALVHWHHLPPLKSLFFSAVAVLRNARAFLVYGLLWMGLSLGVALFLMLVLAMTAMSTDIGVATAALFPLSVVVAAMFFTSLWNWTIERVAYRPLRGSFRLAPLISAIGMSIFLQNWVALGQGARDMAVPALLPGAFRFAGEGGFEIYIPYARVLVIAVTVVLMIGLTLYIRNSRMGRASRACSQDMHMANLLGIDTNRVISFTFILGAMLAAVGGVLIALAVGKLNPFIGFIAGIKAFTAAVLGGIGSIPGAMLGGVLLGIAETLAAAYISSEYKDIVAFAVLVLVLLVRPSGLLGKPEVEKV